jgi:hypothetical protein
MGQDSQQIKVAAAGGLYIARYDDEPKLPTDLDTSLDALFKEVGYASDDGMTFTKSEAVEDVNVWQKQTPARKIVTSRDFAAAASLAQWNRENVQVAFGGGEWTSPKAGVYRFDPPKDYDPLTDWVAVIETKDGERVDRWVVERCNITGDVETHGVRNAAMLLPITLSALTPDGKDRPWYYLSNDDAAFEAAS